VKLAPQRVAVVNESSTHLVLLGAWCDLHATERERPNLIAETPPNNLAPFFLSRFRPMWEVMIPRPRAAHRAVLVGYDPPSSPSATDLHD
jgi:hypothetical protein